MRGGHTGRTCVGEMENSKRKRLAEFEFNMADLLGDYCFVPNANEDFNDDIDEGILSMLSEHPRPAHEAFRAGKLLCPKDICVQNLYFFEHNGIDHHFRMKHNAPLTKNDHEHSVRICRPLHENETKECLEMIFRYREQKVCIFCEISTVFFTYQINL